LIPSGERMLSTVYVPRNSDIPESPFQRLASRTAVSWSEQRELELPPSLPEHVQYVLETEIIEGRLEPGVRVNEEELVRRLGVSRTPAREALRVLESAGLIVRRRGRGTYVASLLSLSETEALFDLRVPIEGYLTARSAEQATDTELDRLDDLVAHFGRLADVRDESAMASLIHLDSEIHWTIYHAARSDLVSVLSSFWGRLIRESHRRIYRGGATRFDEQHRRLLGALRAHDPDMARAIMTEHLETGWQALKESFECESPAPPEGRGRGRASIASPPV
jgi:DNA-binding GntR family transcriptional regulator